PPGCRSESAVCGPPLTGREIILNFDIEERPLPPANQALAQVNSIALNYFKTLGVPILRSRDFTPQDDTNAPPVAIVTEEFVRQFFPGENPIGKRIQPRGSVTPGEPPMREI